MRKMEGWNQGEDWKDDADEDAGEEGDKIMEMARTGKDAIDKDGNKKEDGRMEAGRRLER